MASPRIGLADASQIPFLIQLRQFSQILLHFLPSPYPLSRGLLGSLGFGRKGTEVHLHKAPEREDPLGHRPQAALPRWLVRPSLGRTYCRMARVQTVS